MANEKTEEQATVPGAPAKPPEAAKQIPYQNQKKIVPPETKQVKDDADGKANE